MGLDPEAGVQMPAVLFAVAPAGHTRHRLYILPLSVTMLLTVLAAGDVQLQVPDAADSDEAFHVLLPE